MLTTAAAMQFPTYFAKFRPRTATRGLRERLGFNDEPDRKKLQLQKCDSKFPSARKFRLMQTPSENPSSAFIVEPGR